MVCGLYVCRSFCIQNEVGGSDPTPQKSLYYRLDISKLVSDGRPLSILMMMMTLNEILFFFSFRFYPFFLTPTFITVYAWRISAFASWWCRLPPTVSSTTAITSETKTPCALVRILYPNIYLVFLISFFRIPIVPNEPRRILCLCSVEKPFASQPLLYMFRM